MENVLHFGRKLNIWLSRKWISVICIILILLISIIYAWSAQYVCNFWPINGTFQNYNPVRRLFDGQIPCKDFSVYLGFGHLYLGSFATLLFGNTYAGSLSAFTFLTFFALALFSMVLGKSILKSGQQSKIITVIILVCVLTSMITFSENSILSAIVEALNNSLSPGNSARFLRGLAPVVYVVLVTRVCQGIKWITSKNDVIKRYANVLYIVGISAVGGLIFSFSNDYGISSWLCFGILLGAIVFGRTKKIVKSIVITICHFGLSIVFLILFVSIFTCGNIMDWFNQTFGTGGYQTWYYLSAHSHYIYDVDFSFIMLVQAFLVIFYVIEMVRNNGTDTACVRFMIPAGINMTAFCAANEYRLLSGGELHEVSYTVLVLTILFEIINIVKKVVSELHVEKINRVAFYTAIILASSWCVSNSLEQMIAFTEGNRGSYIKSMGGYMTYLAEDLESTSKFLGDKKVFATYASALETITDQYHPSRYDYIIHVLGDEARNEYLDVFREGDFEYAATIKEELSEWEYWIKSSNWFFYRELYENYHPVYSNSYELFWEKNVQGQNNTLPANNATIQVVQWDNSTYKIIVQCEESICGTADVNIKYHVEKEKNYMKSNFLWFTCVNVNNTSINKLHSSGMEQFNLPNESDTAIPISIVDGYGEVTISSQPFGYTNLIIEDSSINGIFTVEYSYVEVIKIYREDKCFIVLENNTANRKICERISGIQLENSIVEIENIGIDDNSITLMVDCSQDDINELYGKNTYIQVVYE